MSLTATILLIYAACLAGTIASPARSHNDHPHDDRASEGPGARRLLAALLVPALALLAGLQAPPARAGEAAPRIVSGPATVIDGATLDLGGRRLRLYGMDAPDLDQTCSDGHERDYSCGRAAAAALTARIGGGNVTCELREADGSATALCRRDGEDLAAWMVAPTATPSPTAARRPPTRLRIGAPGAAVSGCGRACSRSPPTGAGCAAPAPRSEA
ncbi:UNVERIFIED_ORG: endonuclease YncB(thermonuclease family) [Methylorubrum zatmanii]|nr:endonuclease YncB(thermonuclease family) [Methylorubrum zatmanii]